LTWYLHLFCGNTASFLNPSTLLFVLSTACKAG
jgi:hypothetical protein